MPKYFHRNTNEVAPQLIQVAEDLFVSFEGCADVFDVYFGPTHTFGRANYTQGKTTSMSAIKVFKTVLDVILDHKMFTGAQYEFIPSGELDGIYYRAANRYGWKIDGHTIII